MHSFDAACVGSAKIDLYLSIHQANKHLRLNTETNELCFHCGEKIAVDKCELSVGGNAANVAVGLAHLGLNTSIFAEIGDDEMSYKIINSLKKEGVNVEFIKQSKNQRSSISVILSFKNDRTIFSEHIIRQRDFNFEKLSAKWIYLTSLGEKWKNAYERSVEFVNRSHCNLAFNPGTIQINAGYESIANVLSVTNIFLVNKEEAMKISNSKFIISNETGSNEMMKTLLIKLQKLGPKIVVITDGENGSYAIDENGEIFTHDAIKTNIVEKTGAGDAYSSGFMAAVMRGLSVKDAMFWGTTNAASVIGKLGAQNGLLGKKGMEEKMKRISNV